MKMTKQHFEVITARLSLIQPPSKLGLAHLQWVRTVENFVNMCAITNESFNAVKFRDACNNPEYWKGKL